MTPIARPALNSGLAEFHNSLLADDPISTPEQIANRRKGLDFKLEHVIHGKEDTVSHEERQIPGPAGPMTASIFRPKNGPKDSTSVPGFLHIHGGGYLAGSRFLGIEGILSWVEEFNAVIVSAEYRLAPENPAPAQLEDSYAALVWFQDNAEDLGVDQGKIIVLGGSAGGNLSAGVTLLARDRAGPRILGQILSYPHLDENFTYPSYQQFGNVAPWSTGNSYDAFNYAYGKHRERANKYSLPGRTKDLTGLPPTFIDVGDADIFRDEDVAYASALWKAGVSTELHVWPGAWHGFDTFVPFAPISQRAFQARGDWVRSLLSGSI